MYHYNVPVVKREFLRGFATRGWDPQNPTGRTNAFAVPHIGEGSNPLKEVIWQGMIMSVDEDGKTWKRGVNAGETPGIIAIANNDQFDDDVAHAGTLVGLSCSGQYTYATPYFAHLDAETGEQYDYKAGTKLTFCTNDEEDEYDYVEDGQVHHDGKRSLAGFVRPAKAGEIIIGTVSQTGFGPYNINPVAWSEDPDKEGRGFVMENLNRNAAPFADEYKMPTGVWPLQTTIGASVDSTSKINNAYLVVFETNFTGAVAPSVDPGSQSASI